MKFCTNCGAKYESASDFCTECGTKMKETTTASPAAKPALPSFSKKTKITAVSTIAAASLLFGLYKAGEAYTNPERQLENFTKAVSEGDPETVLSHLSYAEDEGELTEESAAALLNYFKEYPYYKDDLFSVFQSQAHSFQGNITLADEQPLHGEYGELPLISFEKTGKQFLIFDEYEFVVQPQMLSVSTNYNEATFYVNGTETEPESFNEEFVTLGFFPPGIHQVKAVLDSEFMELEVETEVELFYDNYASLWFDIDYTYIESYIADAEVYINGEKTGVTVPAEGDYFGPLLLDGSLTMHLEKETPFGTIESFPQTMGSGYLTFYFTLDDEHAEVIFDTINEFLHSWTEARMDRSMTSVKHAGPALKEQLTRRINSMNRSDEFFIGSLNSISFDLESLTVYEQDGSWRADVMTAENWKEAEYYSNSTPSIYDNLYNTDYTLIYEEETESWLISVAESSWGTLSDNVKEYAFENGDLDEEVHETMMAAVEEDLGQFNSLVYSFVSEYVRAVNSRDASIVAPLIDPAASDYEKEIADYIDYLDSKDIFEDFLSAEATSAERVDDDLFKVHSEEEYIIYYDDGSAKRKVFEAAYHVRMTDDGLKITELLETKETESEEW